MAFRSGASKMKQTLLAVGLSMLMAAPALAKDDPMTWCAATVSGTPGRQTTYYSPMFPTPDDDVGLDARFKQYVATTLAKDPHAVVDAQCIGQATAVTAGPVRKANEASDARLSTVVEIDWRP